MESFQRIWSGVLLLLIAVTWPLWFPAPAGSEWLSAPLVAHGGSMPWWVTALPCVVLLASLSLTLWNPCRFRRAWWITAAALAASFVADQHRLQPWAYQSAIYAVVFACVPPARLRSMLLLPAASVYIYSALGKFDYQFMHTVGQDFLQTVSAVSPVDISQWPIERRAKLALLFPAVELCFGLAVLWRPLRRIAAVGLIGMHLSLLAVLGPWGLAHSRGVLIWNVLLIVQAYLLFWCWSKPQPATEATPPMADDSETTPHGAALFAKAVIALMLLAPMFERAGFWDHWLSWSLYSPHTSRVEIQMHGTVIDDLPPSVGEYFGADDDGDGWHTLDLSAWSLAERHVPIYPQARYQLALAARLSRVPEAERGIRVRLRGTSDRWTGQRSDTRLMGREAIERALQEYWLVGKA